MLKSLFLAAAALSLAAGAANAQRLYPPHVDMPVAAQTGIVPSATNLDAPKSVDPSVEAPIAPVAVDASAIVATPPQLRPTAGVLTGVVETELVTSTPVPDSPAHRALYPPLSRAGKMTAPRGN